MPTPDRLDRTSSRVILIGAASYEDSRFPAVPNATTSLRAMHNMLIDPHLGDWCDNQVTVIDDPSDCRRLAQDVRRIAKNTTGALLLYFVGHGTLTPTGELILALTDTDFDDPDVTGLEFTRIRAALIDSPARVKIVILDCCYSGREINILGLAADLANHTEVRGAYTLTAADRAADAGRSGGCTEFTGQFLNLIHAGLPDRPPVLTFADLYPHLRRRLAAANMPTPNQRGTDTAEHYPVAHNRAAQPNAKADPPPRTSGEQATSSAPRTTRPASTPVRIERRVPWRPSLFLLLFLFCAIAPLVPGGILDTGTWPPQLPWALGGLCFALFVRAETKIWRGYQVNGPLVIDAGGILWNTDGHDREVRWDSVQRVRLIGSGASARIIAWYHPTITPPKHARRRPDDGYLLLQPSMHYGHDPYQAVNDLVTQALVTFAGDKYAK
jgi:hypothetical protein